ncbi:hypothetical protein ES703_84236 [subsurface metagenome]
MHLWVADGALRVVQQYSKLAGPDVQFAQSAHCPVRLSLCAVSIISEIGVPVRVVVQLTAGKNYLIDARHWAGQEVFERLCFFRAGCGWSDKTHKCSTEDDKKNILCL